MKARRARPEDIGPVYSLISHYAAEGLLLPRAEEEIREHISRFLVLSDHDKLIGCVALEPYGADLAEVRSLAVAPEARGRGLGARLLRFAVVTARRRKIARVFALTHETQFFERQGFQASSRLALPEKIERDCCTCPKVNHCDLIALIATVCPDRITLPILAADRKAVPAL